jgi:large subunit ribosomal protein L21e
VGGGKRFMPSSHGYRSKTRKILSREERSGFNDEILGILSLKEGDKASIHIDPSIHKGMPHRRFHGRIVTVLGREGRAFKVEARMGDNSFILKVRPEHLKRI